MPNMLESCWDERMPHKSNGRPQDELLMLVPWLLEALVSLSRRNTPGIWGAPEARLPCSCCRPCWTACTRASCVIRHPVGNA